MACRQAPTPTTESFLIRIYISYQRKTNVIYKLSKNVRKYSSTPLVKVDDKGKETPVLFSPLKKKDGEKFLQEIGDYLNWLNN